MTVSIVNEMITACGAFCYVDEENLLGVDFASVELQCALARKEGDNTQIIMLQVNVQLYYLYGNKIHILPST